MDNRGNKTYLNTPACGLMPESFTEEANKFYKAFVKNASAASEQFREVELDYIRENVANFLNTPKNNTVFIPNFSWGMNGIVHTLNGDEKVLLYDNDYPSLTEPFKINDFDITWVSDNDGFTISLDELKETILSEKIDVVAISHVQWLSGFKLDIKELGAFCKEHGVIFIVDATQSMGAVNINLSEVHTDVFIASVYKWMNAGFGLGVMYVADSFLHKYTPKIGGHNSYSMKDDVWQYIPSARSYEPGGVNMYGAAIVNASVKDKQQRGMSQIEAYNTQLTQSVLNTLSDAGISILGDYTMNNRVSIICIKNESNLWERMQEAGIIAVQRAGNIRIGMHYYNTEADVEQLVNVLKG